jgi:exodeoxyribonuclease-3
VSSEFYVEKEQNRKMASESPKKRASKKKSDAEGAGESAAKKAKTGDKPTMADYMPKEYPAEIYPPAPADCHKIVSWNVNGLNSCYGKGFPDYVSAELPDVLALQETKIQDKAVDEWRSKMTDLGFKHTYWTCSGSRGESAKGYASTAVLSRIKPLKAFYGLLDATMDDIEEGGMGMLNDEGRTITLEFENYYLVNCYVPNSGQKLERLEWREAVWDVAMLTHLKQLEKTGKPVVFTGDLNVAHTAKDLKNDKSNYNKSAGFCQQEIDGFQRYLDAGYVDAYRELYPDEEVYTYFGYRFNAYGKNTGWRIDYFLCSKELRSRIADSTIRKSVYGATDHCPVVLYLKKE